MSLLAGHALSAVANIAGFTTAGDSASTILNILSAIGAYWVMPVVPECRDQVVAMLANGRSKITGETHIEVVPIALQLTSHFFRRKDVFGDVSSFARCHHVCRGLDSIYPIPRFLIFLRVDFP